MSSHGNYDNAANAPYWAVNSTIVNATNVKNNNAAPTAANVALLYGNTTPDVYTVGETIGLFMVNDAEVSAGGDNVTGVSIVQGGSGYVEAPGVSFSGGGGSNAAATATISGGIVTKVAVTNTGSAYTSTPTVTIQAPCLTIPTSAVNTTTDVISYTGHSQANGAAVVYNNGGGTTMAGLTSGNTYYVTPVNANSFKVASSAANAANNITIDITGTGNNGQAFFINSGVRATAAADRGLGNTGTGAHAGWNIKTTGEGGRAGRVQWETLVALTNVQGDGSDDITLPDA